MPVVDDMDESARWIAGALTASGYPADFTPASAWEIDRFFDEQLRKPGKPRRTGLLRQQIGPRLFALGAYVGELIRQNAEGWAWESAEGAPEDEVNVRLQRGDADVAWPMQRVMKRYGEGPEFGIAAYVAAVADIDVGPRPAPPPMS